MAMSVEFGANVAVQTQTASTLRASHDAFLDLIYQDEELLRADFDALIAASWPPSPPSPPTQSQPAGQPPGWPTAAHDLSAANPIREVPTWPQFNRQRAPPKHPDTEGR
jgi:hypothetical protein